MSIKRKKITNSLNKKNICSRQNGLRTEHLIFSAIFTKQFEKYLLPMFRSMCKQNEKHLALFMRFAKLYSFLVPHCGMGNFFRHKSRLHNDKVPKTFFLCLFFFVEHEFALCFALVVVIAAVISIQ